MGFTLNSLTFDLLVTAYQSFWLYHCDDVLERNFALGLLIRFLLADDQIRLLVRASFIPASGIDDQSLPWGICFYPQYLGSET